MSSIVAPIWAGESSPLNHVVVVAASAGGFEALQRLVRGLPANFAAPIIVVLHRTSGRPGMLADLLGRRTPLTVKDAMDGEALVPGVIYIVPADRHAYITHDRRITLRDHSRINFVRSSADPLFRTAAEVFGSGAIGVVLSGGGKNGAAGTLAVHDAGGIVIAQDRQTARYFAMPAAAIAAGAVSEVLPIDCIGERIARAVDGRRTAVTPHFVNRDHAGTRLGEALQAYADDRPLIVLGLPRGGIPVAWQVARLLDAPLDVCVVRKLGVPGHEELAFGAIASGGALVLNDDVRAGVDLTSEQIERVRAGEQRELQRRERIYRGPRRFPVLVGMTVIIVDDGAATGASMRAAVTALRKLGPREIVVAVPVASRAAVRSIAAVADACIAIVEPDPFYRVGVWYQHFEPTSDVEVRMLMADASRRWTMRGRLHGRI